MLPATLQFLIVMIASAMNGRLWRRLAICRSRVGGMLSLCVREAARAAART
jgi:hypothetical protein